MYISDHLFNPRQLESRYTYSKREDGAPAGTRDAVARPDVRDLRLAGATQNLLFTTGVYMRRPAT